MDKLNEQEKVYAQREIRTVASKKMFELREQEHEKCLTFEEMRDLVFAGKVKLHKDGPQDRPLLDEKDVLISLFDFSKQKVQMDEERLQELSELLEELVQSADRHINLGCTGDTVLSKIDAINALNL